MHYKIWREQNIFRFQLRIQIWKVTSVNFSEAPQNIKFILLIVEKLLGINSKFCVMLRASHEIIYNFYCSYSNQIWRYRFFTSLGITPLLKSNKILILVSRFHMCRISFVVTRHTFWWSKMSLDFGMAWWNHWNVRFSY